MAGRGEYGRFYKRSHNETKREALKRDPYLNVKGTINVDCPVLISPGHPFFETRRCLCRKLPQTVASSSIKIFTFTFPGNQRFWIECCNFPTGQHWNVDKCDDYREAIRWFLRSLQYGVDETRHDLFSHGWLICSRGFSGVYVCPFSPSSPSS